MPKLDRRTIEDALGRLAPRMPGFEREAVLDHAAASRTLNKASPEEAAWLSLVAYVRHTLTDYDDLLASGYEVDEARFFVADEMGAVLAGWGVRRTL